MGQYWESPWKGMGVLEDYKESIGRIFKESWENIENILKSPERVLGEY